MFCETDLGKTVNLTCLDVLFMFDQGHPDADAGNFFPNECRVEVDSHWIPIY